MKDFDHLALDGRSLRTFLTVLEEGSVSRAAKRLSVTQSAVSHTLDKLRIIIGDPLFVRAGRGIKATERAISLREPVRNLLDGLKSLSDEREFSPTDEGMTFTIATNDFPRELLFPPLVREFEQEGIDVRFRFMPSGVPGASLLHEGRCQFIISPFPPVGSDVFQRLLFRDRLACFFDADVRARPRNRKEFLGSDYLEVRFPDYSGALEALSSIDKSELKAPRLTVPNFGDLAAFLRGTRLITTQLSAMAMGPLAGFGSGKLPFKTDALALYLSWHRRDHSDPAHAWLRQRIGQQAALAVREQKRSH